MIKDRGPTGARARVESARLIRLLPETFVSYLSQLLEDHEPAVLQEAVRTTLVYRQQEFVPQLIALLGNPEVRDEAIQALVHLGANIQGSLQDYLSDPDVAVDVKREIPELLVIVAGRDAREALITNLIHTDNVLRFRIISALNKLT